MHIAQDAPLTGIDATRCCGRGEACCVASRRCYSPGGLFRLDQLITPSDGGACPGQGHFLINPFGLHYDRHASNLGKIDLDGNNVGERSSREYAGFVIPFCHHMAHAARQQGGDAHPHPRRMAVCAVKEGLLPSRWSHRIPRQARLYTLRGPSLDLDERGRL